MIIKNPKVNVLNFGADPTGTNDSSEAFQKAVDHAIANNSLNLFVPLGEGQRYLVRSKINIESPGFTIEGDAPTTTGGRAGYIFTDQAGQSGFFDYGNGRNDLVTGPFVARGLSFYIANQSYCPSCIIISQDNNGPHRGILLEHVSAENFDNLLLVQTPTPGNIGAASVVLRDCNNHGGTYIANAINQCYGLVVQDCQSEQGSKITGNWSGPVDIKGNMLEGQANPITINSQRGNVVVEGNYFEGNNGGDYLLDANFTTAEGQVDWRWNMMSSNLPTDWARVGYCNFLNNSAQPSESLITVKNGTHLRAYSKLNGGGYKMIGNIQDAKVSSILKANDYINVYANGQEPQATQTAAEWSNNYISDTPIGKDYVIKLTTGFLLTNFATPINSGDIVTASWLVRYFDNKDLSTIKTKLWDNAYSYGNGQFLYPSKGLGDGNWHLVTSSFHAPFSASSARLRYWPYSEASSGSGCEIAGVAIHVQPSGQRNIIYPMYPKPSNAYLTLTEKNADMLNPSEGQSVIWQSDGTATGDDGDLFVKVTASGVTKTAQIFDFSTGSLNVQSGIVYYDNLTYLLANSTELKDGAQIVTRGYYAPGDNGGSEYIYHATGRKLLVDSVDPSTNFLYATGHKFNDGHRVILRSGTGAVAPSGLAFDTLYYAVDSGLNNTYDGNSEFKLSTTLGGSAIDIGTSGTGPIYVDKHYDDKAFYFHGVGDDDYFEKVDKTKLDARQAGCKPNYKYFEQGTDNAGLIEEALLACAEVSNELYRGYNTGGPAVEFILEGNYRVTSRVDQVRSEVAWRAKNGTLVHNGNRDTDEAVLDINNLAGTVHYLPSILGDNLPYQMTTEAQEAFAGIIIRGCQNADVYLGTYANSLGVGVKLMSDVAPIAYNRFYGGYFGAVRIGLELTVGPTGGFTNENSFYGTNFTFGGNASQYCTRAGIVFSDPYQQYSGQNANRFYSPCFQVGGRIASQYLEVGNSVSAGSRYFNPETWKEYYCEIGGTVSELPAHTSGTQGYDGVSWRYVGPYYSCPVVHKEAGSANYIDNARWEGGDGPFAMFVGRAQGVVGNNYNFVAFGGNTERSTPYLNFFDNPPSTMYDGIYSVVHHIENSTARPGIRYCHIDNLNKKAIASAEGLCIPGLNYYDSSTNTWAPYSVVDNDTHLKLMRGSIYLGTSRFSVLFPKSRSLTYSMNKAVPLAGIGADKSHGSIFGRVRGSIVNGNYSGVITSTSDVHIAQGGTGSYSAGWYTAQSDVAGVSFTMNMHNDDAQFMVVGPSAGAELNQIDAAARSHYYNGEIFPVLPAPQPSDRFSYGTPTKGIFETRGEYILNTKEGSSQPDGWIVKKAGTLIPAWASGSVYRTGELATSNGYVYYAQRNVSVLTYWQEGESVSVNDIRLSSINNEAYICTTGGTCGATEPQGYGSGQNDGGAVWRYLYEAGTAGGTAPTGGSGVLNFNDGGILWSYYSDIAVLESVFTNQYTTPEMFGAKGDGSTDDTSAIQAAFDTGKDVLLKNSYVISSQLNLNTEGQHILGGGTLIDNVSPSGLTAMISMTGTSHNSIIENINFEGPITESMWNSLTSGIPNDQDTFYKGVYLRGNNQKVVNCRFSGKQVGAYARLGSASGTIEGCTFNGFFSTTPSGGANYNIAFGGEAPYVNYLNNKAINCGAVVTTGAGSSHNNINGNLGNTLYDNGIYCSTSRHTSITNNIIKDVYGNSGIKARGSYYTVSNNVVENALVGIQVTPRTTEDSSTWNDNIIQFNSGSVEPTIGETLTGASSSAVGIVKAVHYTSGKWSSDNATGWIELDTSVIGWFPENVNGSYGGANILSVVAHNIGGHGNIINSNTVKDCYGIGIAAVQDEDYWQNDVVISDNTITDCGGTGFAAIRIKAHNVLVDGNQINGYTNADMTAAISSLGGINLKISNNSITGSPDVGINLSNCPGVKVDNNIVTANTVLNGGGYNATYQNNTFNGLFLSTWPGRFTFANNILNGKFFVTSSVSDDEISKWLKIIGNRIESTGVAFEHFSISDFDEVVIEDNYIESLNNAGSSYGVYWRILGGNTQIIDRFKFNNNIVKNYSASAGIFPFRLSQAIDSITINRLEFNNNQIYGNRGGITLTVQDIGQMVMSNTYIQRSRFNTSPGENIGSVNGFTKQFYNNCTFGYPSDTARMDTLSVDPDGDVYITNCSFEGMTDVTFSDSVDDIYWLNNDLRGTGDPDISLINGRFYESFGSSIVQPKQFGAKEDGTTDDTLAIQAALDTGNAVIFDTNKYYRITNTLNINTSGQSFIGGNIVQDFSISGLIPMVNINAENVRIKDSRFIGKQLAVDYVDVADNYHMAAIQVNSNYANIDNVDITKKFVGIFVSGVDCSISNSRIQGSLTSHKQSLYHQGITAVKNRPSITNCNIYNIGNGVVFNDGLIGGKVDSCSFNNFYENGVLISSGIACNIVNNTIDNGYGCAIESNGFGNIITNNNIKNIASGFGIIHGPLDTEETYDSIWTTSNILYFVSGNIEPIDSFVADSGIGNGVGILNKYWLTRGSFASGNAEYYALIVPFISFVSSEYVNVDTIPSGAYYLHNYGNFGGFGSIISDNHIDNVQYYGIHSKNSSINKSIDRKTIINNNTLYNVGAPSVYPYGIKIDNTFCSLSNNKVEAKNGSAALGVFSGLNIELYNNDLSSDNSYAANFYQTNKIIINNGTFISNETSARSINIDKLGEYSISNINIIGDTFIESLKGSIYNCNFYNRSVDINSYDDQEIDSFSFINNKLFKGSLTISLYNKPIINNININNNFIRRRDFVPLNIEGKTNNNKRIKNLSINNNDIAIQNNADSDRSVVSIDLKTSGLIDKLIIDKCNILADGGGVLSLSQLYVACDVNNGNAFIQNNKISRNTDNVATKPFNISGFQSVTIRDNIIGDRLQYCGFVNASGAVFFENNHLYNLNTHGGCQFGDNIVSAYYNNNYIHEENGSYPFNKPLRPSGGGFLYEGRNQYLANSVSTDNPPEGQTLIFQASGYLQYNNGDLLRKTTINGTTKTNVLSSFNDAFDHGVVAGATVNGLFDYHKIQKVAASGGIGITCSASSPGNYYWIISRSGDINHVVQLQTVVENAPTFLPEGESIVFPLVYDGTKWYYNHTQDETSFSVSLSPEDDSQISTGTNIVNFRAPYAFLITNLRASVDVAPSGTPIIIDINKNGTSILSDKLTIDATETTSKSASSGFTLINQNIADDDKISFDIDQVGSTYAGTRLKVNIIGYKPY